MSETALTSRTKRASKAPLTPQELWRAEVGRNLQAVLQSLCKLALDGNVTAVKLILEVEGLASPEALAGGDNMAEIVAICTDGLEVGP